MICSKCGNPVPDAASFCSQCGRQVVRDSAAPRSGADATLGGLASAHAGAAAASMPATAAFAMPRLLERVKNILLSPRSEWPRIETEPTSVAQLYSGYVVPLAGFAALMSLVRMSVVGVSLPFGGAVRTPLTSGLMYAVVAFAFGLAGLLLIGVIVNALAPAFSGERNLRQALKTAAYAFTPAWIGTALSFLPLGTLLQLLLGIYGIYLLYLGLPLLMRSRPEKAAGYTATVVLCTILLGVVLGVLNASLGGGDRLARLTGGRPVAWDSTHAGPAADEGAAALGNAIGSALGTDEKGKAGLAQALGNLAKAGEKMQAAGAQDTRDRTGPEGTPPGAMQSAGTARTANAAESADAVRSTGGDGAQGALAATGSLLTAFGGALGGSHRVTPVDFNTLKGMLPSSLAGMRRTGSEGGSQQAMGVRSTSATADYAGDTGSHVQIRVADISGVSGLIDAAGALVPTGDHESDTGFEKDTVLDGRAVHEKYDSVSREGAVEVIVGKRFEVDVSGRGLPMKQLEQTLGSVDLVRLESMRDAGATGN